MVRDRNTTGWSAIRIVTIFRTAWSWLARIRPLCAGGLLLTASASFALAGGTSSDPVRPSLDIQAASGDAAATAELAARLELGLGVAPDPQRAMALFCRAALLGSRSAALHVAAWLLTDDGPDYNAALAADWLRRQQRADRGLRPDPRETPPRCPTDVPTGLPSAELSIGSLVDTLAPLQGVDPALVKSIIAVESGFHGNLVSTAGAAGLMQLMPGTALALRVGDRLDTEQNLRGGIAYLARMLALHPGNLPLALAAYNAGPAVVQACDCVPDNGETVQYVNRVREIYASAALSRMAQ